MEPGRQEGEPRSYFIMIPNMADDELDPFEFRLLAHYTRVCGQDGGRCFQSANTIRDKLGMSLTTISKTRKSLQAKGYIEVVLPDGKARARKENTSVSIIDRWQENAEHCQGVNPKANVRKLNHKGDSPFVPVQEEQRKEEPKETKTEQGLPANLDKLPVPAVVVSVPEQNAIVKIYKPPTTFEETIADLSPEVSQIADDLIARAQPPRNAAEKVDITPDGIQACVAFKARFRLLDEEIQQSVQKLVDKYGLYAVTETIRQLKPEGVNNPVGLLTWKLDDLQRKGHLPVVMAYSPTTTVPNAPNVPVKKHWKYSQVYTPPESDAPAGRLMQNLIERQQQREKEKWHGSSVQSGS